MRDNNSLTLKTDDLNAIKKHLHPGDGLEYAAIMLCHYGKGETGFRLIVKEVIKIPSDKCAEQSSAYISWPFAEYMPPERIEQIDRDELSIVTIHSHPNGYDSFSEVDDENDKALFMSTCNWFDDDRPHGSAIMLPCGKIICRTVNEKGEFSPIQSVAAVGKDIKFWKQTETEEPPAYGLRIAQTFGKGTFNLLKTLRVGVVGCSGTGSIIIELLARNCVGHLTLVDPDVVEEKNLNRIVNAHASDAKHSLPKVEVLKKAVAKMGTGTKIDSYVADTYDAKAIEALVDCDILFGCVDSATGRYHLECIATAYFLPYFDVGVYLEADGKGGISHADAVARYVYPGSSSLMSRGVYTSEQITSEGWLRSDKAYYDQQIEAGYLKGVAEDQPAVMSVNMLAACLAFNDFLSRIHNFRLDSNSDFDTQTFQLCQGYYLNEESNEESPDPLFSKYAGMGEKSILIQNMKKGG